MSGEHKEDVDDADYDDIVRCHSEEILTIGDLYEGKFKPPMFKKTGSRETTYSSHHLALDQVIPAELEEVDLKKRLNQKELQNQSYFLKKMKHSNNVIKYSGEQDIQAYVEYFLEDILSGANLSHTIEMQRQTALTFELKADIWVLKSHTGRPIGVIEVKSPSQKQKNVLEDFKVLGQLYDYMIKLRTSFGQCELIGIVTNLKQWRFGWLEDSNNIAKSSRAHTNIPLEKRHSYLTSFPLTFSSRRMCVTRTYSLGSADLAPKLASCLFKNLACNYRAIPLISSNRVYQQFTADSYVWKTFNHSLVNNADLKFSLPPEQTKKFMVLRFFHRGGDGKVALVVTESFHFVVFKYFDDGSNRIKEEQLWKLLYEKTVHSQTLNEKPVLLIPFAFNCQVDETSSEVSFLFDLHLWGCEGKVDFENHPVLTYWSGLFQTFYNNMGKTPKMIAQEAIEHLAKERLVHRDLEWRHVALLPVIDKDNQTVTDMVPIFIDLTTVMKVETEQIALDEMMQRLEEISEDYKCS